MNKKIIIGISAVLITALFGVGIFYVLKYDSEEGIMPTIQGILLEKESSESQLPQKQQDTLVIALEKELKNCLAGSETESLKDEKSGGYSRLMYFVAKALIENSEKTCMAVKDDVERVSCSNYYNTFTSVFNHDSNGCQVIDDTPLRLSCLAVINSDSEQCAAIESPEKRTSCGMFAVSNFEGCEKLSEKKMRDQCLNEIYLVNALMKRDMESCNKLEGDNINDIGFLACKILLGNDPEKQVQSVYQGACYSKYAFVLAEAKKDPTVCEKLPFKDSHNRISYADCIAASK